MKSLLTGIFTALALLCGLAIAQDATQAPTTGTAQAQPNSASAQPASPSSAQPSSTPRIAPGSVIPVQLTKGIDAKKLKVGDEVEAKVTQDMKAGNGEVIVPKDTKVVGRVTEAQARNKEQKESQIGIAFDHAVMKTGEVKLPMSIQAIISPSYLSGGNNGNGSQSADQPSSTPSASGMSPGTSNGRSSGTGTPQPSAPTSEAPSGEQTGNSAHQPITGNTEGVLGIQNMTLSTNAAAAQGSVVSSDKNNVKLDSGTLMLLRVTQ